MSCNNLTKCLISNPCPTPAGINGRVWIGMIADIDTTTLTFGTDGDVTAFGLNSGASLKKFVSRRYKQTARHENVKGENGRVTYNHFVDLVHYINNQEDVAALEELNEAEDLFCIVQLNSGKVKVYGLGRPDVSGYGLSGGEGGQTEGVAIGDDNTDKTTLSGELPNKPMFYKPSASLASIISELDVLTDCGNNS